MSEKIPSAGEAPVSTSSAVPATAPPFPDGWSSLAGVCLGLLAVTGLGLVFFYQPTPDGARASLVELREASSWAFLRSLHLWASHGLVIAGWLYLLRTIVAGAYRRRRVWRTTLLLGGVVLALAWTGSLLPAGGGPYAASLRAIYALHILVLPVVGGVLVVLWRAGRRPSAGKTPEEMSEETS